MELELPHPSSAVDPRSDEAPSTPKRRKLSPGPPPLRWSTTAEERLYSSSLLSALRRLRPPATGRLVRSAADRALASAARGRTRWSRAILRRRSGPARSSARRPRIRAPRPAGAGEEKVRALGRLVPGCGRLRAGKVLAEAADYVAALEMQVRALTAIYQMASAMGGPHH